MKGVKVVIILISVLTLRTLVNGVRSKNIKIYESYGVPAKSRAGSLAECVKVFL